MKSLLFAAVSAMNIVATAPALAVRAAPQDILAAAASCPAGFAQVADGGDYGGNNKQFAAGGDYGGNNKWVADGGDYGGGNRQFAAGGDYGGNNKWT